MFLQQSAASNQPANGNYRLHRPELPIFLSLFLEYFKFVIDDIDPQSHWQPVQKLVGVFPREYPDLVRNCDP